MKKKGVLLLLVLLFACSRTQMMSREQFETIRLGEPIDKVEAEAGRANSVVYRNDGTAEYIYIERISDDRKTLLLTRYVLEVKEGEVVSKHVDYKQPAAYDLLYEEDPNYTSY